MYYVCYFVNLPFPQSLIHSGFQYSPQCLNHSTSKSNSPASKVGYQPVPKYYQQSLSLPSANRDSPNASTPPHSFTQFPLINPTQSRPIPSFHFPHLSQELVQQSRIERLYQRIEIESFERICCACFRSRGALNNGMSVNRKKGCEYTYEQWWSRSSM